jgi:protein disulfide-isomerase-like protein
MEKAIVENETDFKKEEALFFLTAWKNGAVEPFLRTAELPAQEYDDHVKVVVGKSFKEIVLNEHDDVLIEFYSPSCPHCEDLAPIYAKLAKKLRKVKNLVIAKMDAVANSTPYNYGITGFPTVYFAPQDNKEEPILFEGEKTYKNFLAFLKEHSDIYKAHLEMKGDL